jgi:NAD(P)-dependent dehydrogenase (short-subunit alcohol dehydrogenase family)
MNPTMLERFSLSNKVALVTGGGSGIGKAYCHALGESGAKVAVVDINLEAAEQTVKELTAKKVDSIAIKTDVTREEDVNNMVQTVIDTWGTLTIGVNNAGMGVWSDALTMPFETWRKILALNLDAVFLCARAEARVMKEYKYGKIINTASMSAHISNTPQNQCAYNASKAGVLHLTRSLAAEWAPYGITVNSISPGYTKTDLVENLLKTPEGKSMLPKWLEKIPMNRMASTNDLQGAIVYLASSVSDYTTGSDILVDGGYCTW